MASLQSTGNLIADRYAFALYELSSKKKCVYEVLSNLQILKEYINQNKDFKLLKSCTQQLSPQSVSKFVNIPMNNSQNCIESRLIEA